MEAIYIDYLAVLIAAVLNMLIGFFWYSKWLFGPAWLKLSGASEKELKKKQLAPLWGFLVALWTAYLLAFFEAHLYVTTVSDGMFVGLCAFLGFSMTTQITGLIWGTDRAALFFLNAGKHLVSFVVMGGILGA